MEARTCTKAYLGNEHQTKGDAAADQGQRSGQREGEVGHAGDEADDGKAHQARQHHRVDGHADVLGIVQDREGHVSSFPRQERSKDENQPCDRMSERDNVCQSSIYTHASFDHQPL